MNPFDYKNMKFLNFYYQNLLGHKFNTKYIAYSLRRNNTVKKHGTVRLYSGDELLFESTLLNKEKEKFLLAFPFIIQQYTNVSLVDDIVFITPILEDLCKSTGIKYRSNVGLSTLKKEYLYAERMYECFTE